MLTGKILEISAVDVKYLDPTQIASIQMIDGTTIIIKGKEVEEGFVEEEQQNEHNIKLKIQRQRSFRSFSRCCCWNCFVLDSYCSRWINEKT